MRPSASIVALAAGVTAVSAQAIQGFNYGATNSDGSLKDQQRFEDEFKVAKQLVGTSGWASARLYTSIQGGTTSTPIDAIPAAIAQDTTILLGIWASGGQEGVTNEIAAIKAAIEQYGEDFTKRVTGLSVGSEDLYRLSPTGIAANSGAGANPDELVKYINQVRAALKGTDLENVKIGHVDTWNDWTNSSNSAVVEAVDWLGFDGYPYFESTHPNSIDAAEGLFDDAYAATVAAAQGKDVWVTETGWPVSGPESGAGVASIENARIYWEKVACKLIGKVNTYWYTLQDAYPSTPNPSFGIVGTELSTTPLYDLSCPAVNGSSTAVPNSTQASSAFTDAGSATATTGAISAGLDITADASTATAAANSASTTATGAVVSASSVARIVSLDSSTTVSTATVAAGTGAAGSGASAAASGSTIPTGGPGGGSYNGGNGTVVYPTGGAGGSGGSAAGTDGSAGASNTVIGPSSSQFLGAAAATAKPMLAAAAGGLMAVMAAL